MIEFGGSYFDGRSSRPYYVRVRVEGDGKGSEKTLSISGDSIEESGILLKECRLLPALGKTARSIILPDGSRLDTDEIDEITEVEALIGANRGMRFVVLLESHWRFVLVSFAGLLLATWLFMSYGIPAIAKKVALAIPPGVTETLSLETLEFLDDKLFAETKLSEERVKELQDIFQGLVSGKDAVFNFRLEFRRGNKRSMPNAFALPSGIVIMTDGLINLSESNDELIGILYHEITHVEERHSMRGILQNTGVFFLVSALVGDIASITSVASTIPTVLATTGYSRQFEREADEGAGAYMIKKGLTTKPLRDILIRLTKDDSIDIQGFSLISTHPGTEERVKMLKTLDSAGES